MKPNARAFGINRRAPLYTAALLPRTGAAPHHVYAGAKRG